MDFKSFISQARLVEGALTGHRVRLKPTDDSPSVHEEGVVVTHEPWDDTVVLEVDEKYRSGPADDGLRECVASEWVEEVLQ